MCSGILIAEGVDIIWEIYHASLEISEAFHANWVGRLLVDANQMIAKHTKDLEITWNKLTFH